MKKAFGIISLVIGVILALLIFNMPATFLEGPLDYIQMMFLMQVIILLGMFFLFGIHFLTSDNNEKDK